MNSSRLYEQPLKKAIQKVWSVSLANKLAFIALVGSFWLTYYTVKHNEKVTMPVLQFSVFEESNDTLELSDDSVGVKVENIGLGPAKVLFSEIYLIDQSNEFIKIEYLSQAQEKVEWLRNFYLEWADIHPLSFISVGKTKNIIKLLNQRPVDWNQGRKIFSSVCYCSIYEQCFFASTLSYHTESSCGAAEFSEKTKIDIQKAKNSFNGSFLYH